MDTNETYDALDYLNTNHSVNGTDSGVDLEVSQNFWMNGGSASGAIDTLCYYSDNTLETTLLCDKSNIFLDYLNMGYFDAPHTMSPNNVDMATNLSWYLDAISVLNQSSHPITYWVDHSEVPQNIGIYNNNFVGDNPENSAHYHWNRTKTSLPNLVYFWENSPVVSYKFYPGISNPLYFATLNDSSLIYGFWRNQGRCSKGKQCIDPYPNSAYNRNLSKQITDLILNNLIQHNLYSIIPSHFGSSGNTSTNTFRTIFDSNTTTQLHTLADYNKGTNGKNKSIYVTTTGKLLRYAEVSTFLNYTYDGSKITINSVNSTIRNFTPTVDDLEGITFNVPITTSVFIGTTNVTSFIVPNPADSSGQVSIMFPLKRLTYPYPKISKVGSYSIDSAGVVTWNRNSQRPSINQAINISLIPSSDSVNITVSIWNTTGDYRKVWNESSSNHSVTTQHTIGDFPIHTNVIVLKNGATYGNFPSNSTGAITFIYSDGYSEIQFYASESNQKSLPNPSNGVILTIAISSALYGYYLWRKRHM
ncbi:MAG: hypothetical protein K8F55_14900 [Candidatus Methanoperedens nitroreducens]|nr:hypothetical protein [Candidatus Methanoperedens nitroreducens]